MWFEEKSCRKVMITVFSGLLFFSFVRLLGWERKMVTIDFFSPSVTEVEVKVSSIVCCFLLHVNDRGRKRNLIFFGLCFFCCSCQFVSVSSGFTFFYGGRRKNMIFLGLILLFICFCLVFFFSLFLLCLIYMHAQTLHAFSSM